MIEIQPATKVSATIEIPPSKSYTNRALIIAALAEGESRLLNPLLSDDSRYMEEALVRFAIPVRKDKDGFVVTGRGARMRAPEQEVFVGNAGTTLRFLTTFAALAEGVTHLTGDERMQERPVEDLLACLRAMGVDARSVKNNRCPPLEIHGGSVPGGTVNLAGDKSSQYLTSLLLSAPYFQNDTTLQITGDLTSKSYADITLDIMKAFGVCVENDAYQRFHVSAAQKYHPRTYTIEGDWSSASYFLGAAAVTGGEVTLTGLNPESVQGDRQFLGALEKMGCQVETSAQKIRIRGNPLHGISIHMNNMPDAVQTLAVVALFAQGKTTITGISNLRIKETDRIDALARELSRLGARVDSGDDYLEIEPGTCTSCEVETYNDHRMAMSFALAGLRIPGIRIRNPQCVAKSFPDFFDRFKRLYE